MSDMLGEFLSGLGHFHLDGANFKMQTHIVPKIMHQKAVFFTAVALRPNWVYSIVPWVTMGL